LVGVLIEVSAFNSAPAPSAQPLPASLK